MVRRCLASALALSMIAALSSAPALPAASRFAQERGVDPVLLSGAQFPTWSGGPELTFREPQTPTNYDTADTQARLPKALRSDCYAPGQNPYDPEDPGDHNCSQKPRVAIYGTPGRAGVPIDRLLGYKWDGGSFVQIPLQVDERFTRYLSNNVSGFAFYSGVDQYLTYAFDREGYRFTDSDPADPCRPIPRADPTYDGQRIVAEPDPLPGLDDNDEIAFMVRSTGEQAPSGATLPIGVESASEVVVVDPSDPGVLRYAYVMLATGDGPAAAFDASNGFVRYAPDANARSTFVFSESSYEGYGAAPKGPYCLADGTPTGEIGQRRPLDTAWIRTPRYEFRYDGRWLMTELHVSASNSGDWTYGPDLIDRWKARAFQQDPSSETPCCGYEEEDTNWGGSGILMGERSGPVRTIRETWGADSSTNNVRRETFYRDMILFGDALRVHPIPPLDGIYTQWDYNAGRMSRYFNPIVADGVAIDGKNDEVFGNLDDPCNADYDDRDEGLTQIYRDAYEQARLCDAVEYHQSVDVTDPTLNLPSGTLQWEQVSGPYGSLVTRWRLRDVTPGGAAHSVVSVPYYRDDSCFDDGTGTDPGPRRRERSSRELKTYRVPGSTADLARLCWDPSNGLPNDAFVAGPQPSDPDDPQSALMGDEYGDERYFQGDIGTHGLHILVIAESDNAQLTVPTTEIVSEQRMVVLPGDQGNVGERYGYAIEFPIVAIVRPL
ncbi:MAG TPA: hypothetical protein VJ922_01470 [Actinomycetota bacterium]|nr:hypothetical protein [Actinomycetota bacterium]